MIGPAMADFDSAIADFTRFAVQQSYPASLLWTSPEFVLFWRKKFFVLAVDLEERRLQAKASYDTAIARNVGIAIEGKCRVKTAPFVVYTCHMTISMLNVE